MLLIFCRRDTDLLIAKNAGALSAETDLLPEDMIYMNCGGCRLQPPLLSK